MKTVFIYALYCPITGEIRYVGKSTNPKKRLQKHLVDKEVCWRTNWINLLRKKGAIPVLEILDEVPESEWPQWEVAYIEFFREQGCDLVNSTAGGKGGLSPSPETRAKQSASQKELRARVPHPRLGRRGKRAWNKGLRPSEETIAKLRAANLGKKPWNAGTTGNVKLKPEACEKLSVAAFGQKRISNASGFVGVCWDKRDKKYRAYCTMRGVRRDLGYFAKIEDAIFVRALAESLYCSRI